MKCPEIEYAYILLSNGFAFVLKIYYILHLITNKYYRNNRIIMIRAFHYLKYFSVKKKKRKKRKKGQ